MMILSIVAQLVVGEPHLVELQPAVDGATAEQRVGHRARLLVDLLAHEPVVAVLLGRRQVPVDVVAACPRPGHPSKVGDLDGVAGDRHDLVLAELQRLAGVLDERRDIGAEEVLALTDPHDQRRVAASGDDPRGIVGIDGDEREGPLEPRQTRCIAVVQIVLRQAPRAPADAPRPRCRSRRGARDPLPRARTAAPRSSR